MSWIAIVLAVLAVLVAIKVAGMLLKLALWGVAIIGLWWFAHPYLGLPFLPF